MKVPKAQNKYCPKCKKHTPHKVAVAKRKGMFATHPLARGGSPRQAKRGRGVGIGMGNRGRYSRKAISAFKMTGKKLTKKTDFRYTCGECKKTYTQAGGIRLRKVEMT